METHEAPLSPYQFTGFLLRRAFVVSHGLAEVCIGEVSSVQEVPVLALLSVGGMMSQRGLGDILGLNRTTAGHLVGALEAKGWLARTRDARDRRSYAVRITRDGIQALADLYARLDHGEAELTQRLTPGERYCLGAELRRLLADDATLAIQGLGNHCSYLIARAHKELYRRARRRLAPLGLSPRDLGLLTALASAQPCSQQRLAELVGVSAPAVLSFVEELEAAGLVSRRRCAADRRAYDLKLTAEGATRLSAGRRVALEIQAEVVEALGPEGDADLRRLLGKVIGADTGSLPPAVPQGPSPMTSADAVDLRAVRTS